MQLQLLPVCSRAPRVGSARIRVCTHVCSDLRARAPPPRRTRLAFLGKILIHNNFSLLLSHTHSWPWTMSNNMQLRRMQINLILCSPAMQPAAHLRDTKLVYTWYTKSAGWFHQSLQRKRKKKKKKKRPDPCLYISEVGVLDNKGAFPMMQCDKDWPTCSPASHCWCFLD